MGNPWSKKSYELSPEMLKEVKMETGFSSHQVKRLFSRFQELDTDGTQYLTRDDLHQIKEVFLNPVGERIVNLFFVHGNERLTFPRFARTFAIFRPLKKSTPEDAINSRAAKLQLLFNLADSNNDGFVCKEDLYELLEMMMGAKLGEEQLNLIVDRVLTEADTDTDGKMSLPEFREVTKNLKIEAELAFISFS